ncbi:MAG: ATPase with chaperone activity, ATP-binding subunit [Parcubacteria group bacterium GW2011_GWA2_43_17]|nr:MAG: ATPase with chaperone activity, ATP-binding subunit [Parcubacteria group bacterium GW2011_GWA2_43_17]KKT92682.1 MAG: ATPase with chaperone activity, ATP-binding subunit [Parcubacteria group bacterium GW2011_GWF2_45_11]KKT98481.1 MAG: ATPase with chaperone activity, ATP-binding subunit [Parcubacteria group bacterium GW2011_GWC2_45_15]OGY93609.1 MAG: hypothetical protein A3J95_04620 [Candidatus Komeilibacteria bacterium RIFOXYC2_FULL_45_12]HBV01830.1 hypothetical protein [Candidatus Komei
MADQSTTANLELEGRELYWGRPFNKTEIFFRQLVAVVKLAVRSLLFLTAVAGVGVLAYHIFLALKNQLPLNDPLFWQGRYFDYFLWSVVLDMYLFYNLGLDAKRSYNVIRKSFKPQAAGKAKLKKVDMSDSFSLEALRVLDKAYLKAWRSNKAFNLLFIFSRLLSAKIAAVIFGRLGLSVKDIKIYNKKFLENLPRGGTVLDQKVHQVLSRAYDLAYRESRPKVEVTDLLQAVSELQPEIQEILYEFKITPETINNVVKWANIQKKLSSRYKHLRAKAYFKPKGTMDRAMTAMATPMLDSFSEDYTQLARAGYLPLCVARDQELSEIFNIIEGGKNSVVLVGLPGVGKSNIVEGIANMMVTEDVPKILRDKRFVSLSIPHLVAGASRPNQLEERLMIIFKEISRAGNIVLHIDDVHNLVGVTSVGSENVDLSEILAKFLIQKGVITIATTNPADYRHYLEGHPLNEVLQQVIIAEPEDNQAIQMIESKAGFLEGKNQIFFSYDALAKAVKLSRRYIPDHYLPDKAFKILEEVAVQVRQSKGKNHAVTGEDVAGVISAHTHIPLTEVTQAESEKLLNLEARIHQRMVDQAEAVNFVASALRRARAELRDTKRPIANFLFLGPTGVGKTELAKTVAQVYFGAEEKMVRLDMSEYQLKDSVNRLLGSQTTGQGGAVRGEGGVLTEAIRKQPFTLLLLDELEKAHPDILNIFLQVMDDGRLTDAIGRTVDFSNCIIIATANAGTQFIQDRVKAGESLEEIKNKLLLSELRQYFKPEFLNRFDGIVVFKPLAEEHIFQIAGLMLGKVKQRLADKGIYLEVTPEAQAELATAGFDPMFGARPLRRVIQERVDSALADYLLQGKLGRRDKVILEAGGRLSIEKADKF